MSHENTISETSLLKRIGHLEELCSMKEKSDEQLKMWVSSLSHTVAALQARLNKLQPREFPEWGQHQQPYPGYPQPMPQQQMQQPQQQMGYPHPQPMQPKKHHGFSRTSAQPEQSQFYVYSDASFRQNVMNHRVTHPIESFHVHQGVRKAGSCLKEGSASIDQKIRPYRVIWLTPSGDFLENDIKAESIDVAYNTMVDKLSDDNVIITIVAL